MNFWQWYLVWSLLMATIFTAVIVVKEHPESRQERAAVAFFWIAMVFVWPALAGFIIWNAIYRRVIR